MQLKPLLCLIPALVAQAQAPVLTFEKVHHSFGRIPQDKKVTVRYKATNTGNAMLNISHLNPSCGCTATVPGKWTLNPGESTEIETTFDPKGQRGVVRKSVQVQSNDAKNPMQTLTFEAEVVRDVILKQAALFFLEVPRTTVRKGSVRLESGSGQQVEVSEVKAPGAPYLSSATRTEGKDVVVDFTFDPRKVPQGQQRGVDKVLLRTNSAIQPTEFVDIQWELKASVAATPEKVVFKDAAGKELRATLVFKQADGKAFTVTGAKPTSPLLRVEGLGRKAAEQTLTVVLAGNAKAGTYNEKIEFTTDDPDQPTVQVRVAAILN